MTDVLSAVHAELEALPWSRRCRLVITRDERGLSLQRGPMHAYIRAMRDGRVEVIYEQALHDTVRVPLPLKAAVTFLVRVLWRDQLSRVETPDADASAATREAS